MKQEEQEELLSQLAKTKIPSKFDEIADDVLIAEDPDEYWGIMDGIQLGAGNKTVWAIEFEEDLVAVFIDKTFEELKEEIQNLPNKLTVEEKKQVVAKARELVPDARFIYIESGTEDECRVVVDSMENDKHGTIINNVRLCYVLDPKRYTKKIPAGAIS
jgi:hypothetical protein